jgi:N-acetylglucosaminyl-diphospho-decaprenol L-rhamnosyltransferase
MISAVVITYNSAECVADCLASVRRALPDAELVVVDNDSRDRTVDVAAATMEGVRLIELDENVGFGRACNVGVELAVRPHVLFLNPDTRVGDVDRDALVRLLARRPFGLVAPAFDDEPERRRVDSRWLPELISHAAAMLRPREWRPSRVRHARDGARAWVGAAMLLVARDEFLTLGGFDPRFFLYYEDRDLSRRYRESGLPIETTEALRGTHEGGASSTHDGLRAAPTAWGLLGWIQYVSIYSGPLAAYRSARAALLVLRGMRTVLRPLGATGWGRARRKARQLEEVLRFLAARASSGDRRFCPDALDVLRRVT